MNHLSRLVFAAIALACLALPSATIAAEEAWDEAKPLHHTDAFVCKRCHLEIFPALCSKYTKPCNQWDSGSSRLTL